VKTGLQKSCILVTRPVKQADKLCRLIENSGGIAMRFPTIEIVETNPQQHLWQAAFASDWLIFTSTNAVDFAIKTFSGKMSELNKPRIAAIGQSTAMVLHNANWSVDCVPMNNFNSEGLLAEEELQNIAGKTCTIVRGVGGLEKLSETLRSRGARVIYLEVYQRRKPDVDAKELIEKLTSLKIHAVTITSGEALHNLLAMLDKQSVILLRALPLVVVSERIKQMAEQLGFKWIEVSKPADSAILETLKMLFNGENSGRSNRTTTRNSSFQLGS